MDELPWVDDRELMGWKGERTSCSSLASLLLSVALIMAVMVLLIMGETFGYI